MTTRFISGDEVWPAITRLSRSAKRTTIAVAYFTDKDHELLSLHEGDGIVVNLSLRTLKSGATNPHALQTLLDKGVSIFNAPQLHAKTFIFDNTLVVGSANVSATSAKHHDEACLITNDKAARERANQFVRSLCHPAFSVDSEFLEQCKKQWRPPIGGGSRANLESPVRRMWFLPNLTYRDFSDEDNSQANDAVENARHPRMDQDGTEPYAIIWPNNGRLVSQVSLGDLLLMRIKDRRSATKYICRPLPFLRTVPRRKGKKVIGAFLLVEKPIGMPDVPFTDFNSRLPRSLRPVFGPGSRVKAITDAKVIDAVAGMWTPKGRLSNARRSRTA